MSGARRPHPAAQRGTAECAPLPGTGRDFPPLGGGVHRQTGERGECRQETARARLSLVPGLGHSPHSPSCFPVPSPACSPGSSQGCTTPGRAGPRPLGSRRLSKLLEEDSLLFPMCPPGGGSGVLRRPAPSSCWARACLSFPPSLRGRLSLPSGRPAWGRSHPREQPEPTGGHTDREPRWSRHPSGLQGRTPSREQASIPSSLVLVQPRPLHDTLSLPTPTPRPVP